MKKSELRILIKEELLKEGTKEISKLGDIFEIIIDKDGAEEVADEIVQALQLGNEEDYDTIAKRLKKIL